MIPSGRPEVFFDIKKAIIFSDPIGSRKGACFNLTSIGCNSKICDKGILGFPRAMGNNSPIVVFLSKINGSESFC